jgi:hypothetical protein
MFSNEIIVKGNYVSGTIKKNDGNKDSSHHPYILHSGLNFGGRGGTTWASDKLREIIAEMENVIIEMDKQNGEQTKEICKYCTGRPFVDREPLMKAQLSDYNVFINGANHLEDNVVGGSVSHSLYGVKINFCPVCGRKL